MQSWSFKSAGIKAQVALCGIETNGIGLYLIYWMKLKRKVKAQPPP